VRCLVVGGAGYLGGRVVDAALAAGYEVRVYDNLTYEDAYLRDVDFVFGDVRARTRLAQHLIWADSVVWLAGIVGDGACALDPLATTEINYDAVTWLVDHFDGRIIFTSTCSVYGAQDGLLTEDSPTEPLSLYALSKLAAESHLSGRDALIFRLGTLYGLGGRVRLDLVLNTFTARAVTDRRLRVFGGGQWRPLLHVQDAADGIVTGMKMSRSWTLRSESRTRSQGPNWRSSTCPIRTPEAIGLTRPLHAKCWGSRHRSPSKTASVK
jgi:nucleoside-diphosphate-sugar epimerase